MKRATRWIGLVIAACVITGPAVAAGAPQPQALNAHAAAKVRVAENYGRLPLSFEANRGQTDGHVKFLSRGSGYNLFLTSTEAVLALSKPEGKPSAEQPTSTSGTVVRMKLIGGNSASRITGLQELPGKSNYFIGNDSSKWRTNIPSYARVRYDNVYPGVDLVYYGNQRQLEYDFVVAPGADPRVIKLAFGGASEIQSDASGDLIVRTAGGDLRMHKPLVFQEVDGVRKEIAAAYLLDPKSQSPGSRSVSFQVAAYDASKPLVIDPVLAYSTYLGGGVRIGGNSDQGLAIAVDSAGNAYVTGQTSSPNFPTTAGAFDQTANGGSDVFVTKLNSAGSALVYSTYLGGTSTEDLIFGIAVDAAGHAYVTGRTGSANFPTTSGAFNETFNGNLDGFVTKLNPTGSALVYSTYLGGSGFDLGSGIAVDAAGHAYVTGQTTSANFPTTPGAFSPCGGTLAFVTKLNPSGSGLVYSTCVGGSISLSFIAVDGSGNAYISGVTTGFPTTPGAFDETFNGNFDAFVAKLDPAGSALVYSTYLGGSGGDQAFGIAVDSDGHAYVTGVTRSTDFPTTPGAFQTVFGGGTTFGGDAFVTKLNPAGSALVYSTFLGGSRDEQASGIAVDASGNAHVTGFTNSTNFPTTAGALQTGCVLVPRRSFCSQDAFVAKLNPAGSALVYSTYLGGGGDDAGMGIAVDAAGNAYVAGITRSADFPTTAGAFDQTLGFGDDAFVAKIVDSDGTVGAAGGTISDEAGTGAAFGVPADVLAQTIDVAITVIPDPGAAPPAGFAGPATEFVSFTLVPNPSPLPLPGATLTLPLASSLPTGSPISLFKFNPVTAAFLDTGIVGTVDAGGTTATFSGVTQFSIFVGFLDNEPPVIAQVAATPNALWPPNHRMVPVSVAVSVSDRVDPAPTCHISSVTSNEAPDSRGAGHTLVDWEVTGSLTANLRAERNGTGVGRIYTLTIECRDATGNAATASALVTVPHDRSQ